MQPAPWQLRLEVTKDLRMRVTLRNASRVEQPYLLDARLQPVSLEIMEGARAIEFEDGRAIAKYDATIYRDSYGVLKAGGESGALDGVFAKEANGYAVRFGMYSAASLKAGAYSVRAVWTSSHDDCIDAETRRLGTVSGVWKGRVESNSVEVRLP